MSKHWAWCPPEVHTNTGRLCSAGSKLPTRSPTSTLVCSPPTPCPCRPRLRSPLPWPPSMRVLVLCHLGRRHVYSRTCRASETGHRLSALPGLVEERRGPPRFLGRPLHACPGRTPRRRRAPPRPTHAEGVVAFRSFSTLGIREGERLRGRRPHGPHARRPTHRRPCFPVRRKACYRPGRAHPWPGEFRTRWTMNEVS